MLGEVKTALSIFDWVKKLLRENKKNVLSETIADRFVMLFENHGVHRNQIPRFFGHGLTIESVQTNEQLIKVLTEDALKDSCELFGIRREWLDGADKQVYEIYDFYKYPEGFLAFIKNILARTSAQNIDAILLIPGAKDNADNSVIIFQEQIGSVEERPIYRHFISNDWLHSYWKSRVYLTACVAIAWKHNVYMTGKEIPFSEIDKLLDGNCLLGYNGNGKYHFTRNKIFYPENMTLYPDKFLERIDPEQNNYGRISALELWLHYDSEGYMDSGIRQESVRDAFEKQLEIERKT